MSDARTKVAGGLLIVIGLIQLARFLLGWQVTVNGNSIPVWVSGIAALVLLVLGFWLLKPCCRKSN